MMIYPDGLQLTAEDQLSNLRTALRQANANLFMRRVVLSIFAQSGYDHALATVSAWLPRENIN